MRTSATIIVGLLAMMETVEAFGTKNNDAIGIISTRSRFTLKELPQVSRGHSLSRRKAKNLCRFHSVGPLRAGAGSPIASSLTSALASSVSSAGALAVLAGIILVHESGHYLAARTFGIEVEEFSVGFGPKIAGVELFGNAFNLRFLPLGGYVRFPENYNTTLVLEQERKAFEAREDNRQQKNERSVGDSILNALTFGVLERCRNEKQKKELERQAQERNKLPWWKKIGSSSNKDAASNNPADAGDDIEIEYYDDPNLLQNRSWRQRAVVLSAGVIFNLLLSFSLYFGEISYGSGIPRRVFEAGAAVVSRPLPSAAASGLLQAGDIILGINGEPVSVSQRPDTYRAQQSIDDFIKKIRSTPDGESIKLSVLHPKERNPVEVNVKPRRTILEDGSTAGPQTIGVSLKPNIVRTDLVRSDSVLEAASLATQYVGELTRETGAGLLSVFAGFFSGSSSGAQVSGPIGLIRSGSEVVSTKSWTPVILFAAAISVNLAVINAFPLPALDGGQLVFVLFEGLTGRKVNQRLEEGITSVFILLLILLSASAAFGDITSIFFAK